MKKNTIFWISYSDLMSSMFFIMMILFVITISYLKSVIKTTENQLQKIQELQTAVQQLPSQYFEYQPHYKRFKLKEQIQFDRGIAEINPKYTDYLTKVGHSIVSLIDTLNKNEEYKKFDIKYLIVVEGMASKDKFKYNYELSYNRALALYKLWQENGINFDQEKCEIQISGSGIEGIREYSDSTEYKNQQFLIHIIPKMGRIIESDTRSTK